MMEEKKASSSSSTSSLSSGGGIQWPLQDEKTGKAVTTATNIAIWKAFVSAAAASAETQQDGAPQEQEQVEVAATRIVKQLEDPNTTKTWRHEYRTVIESILRIQAAATPATAINMCRAGLQAAHEAFVFVETTTTIETTMETISINNTKKISLTQAFRDAAAAASVPGAVVSRFDTFTCHSKNGNSNNNNNNNSTSTTSTTKEEGGGFRLASPHGTDESPLYLSSPTEIQAQLTAWAEYGCMEPSAVEHALTVFTAPDPSVFVQDKVFILLGITSELGPAKSLLQIPGCVVLGIARPGRRLQQFLTWYENHGAVNTQLQIPISTTNTTAAAASDEPLPGADLLHESPAILFWILERVAAAATTTKKTKELVLCPLAYMDGEANVRLTMAMDAIIISILQYCRTTSTSTTTSKMKVSLSYLTSPLTCYAIPPSAAAFAKRLYQEHQKGEKSKDGPETWSRFVVGLASWGNWLLQPSNTWLELADDDKDKNNDNNNASQKKPIILNAIATMQGPNYCLSKALQQWRCMVAAAAALADNDGTCGAGGGGGRVSAPHAPPTRSLSVTHSSSAAAALEGFPVVLEPIVIFNVEPCSTLMTAIMLSQLWDKNPAAAAAKNEKEGETIQQRHPLELFWDGSVDGGVWRTAYQFESAATLAYLVGKALLLSKSHPSNWSPPAALAAAAPAAQQQQQPSPAKPF